MRLTKATPLADLKGAAALQAWQTDQQLQKGDLSEFQRAYFLNELAAAYLQLSLNIIDAHGLAAMMAEAQPTQPVLPKPARTRRPPPTKPAPPRPKPRTGRKPDA